MKKLFPMLAVAVLCSGLALVSRAADEEKTFTGDGMCAKCSLNETPACQNALQVEEKGSTVTYYLVKNDVSNAFHKNICKATKKIKVTGTVKEVDGKKEITASKIELAK
jgi:hypothetical protein